MFRRLFGASAAPEAESAERGAQPVTLRQLVERREEKARDEDVKEADEAAKSLLANRKEEEPVALENSELVAITSELTDEERALFAIKDHLKLHNILGRAVVVMSFFVAAGSAYLYATM